LILDFKLCTLLMPILMYYNTLAKTPKQLLFPITITQQKAIIILLLHPMSTACLTNSEIDNPQLSQQQKAKRKRKVLLDEDAEKIIKEEEREEFVRVIQDQFAKVDVAQLGTLPEAARDPLLHVPTNNTWEYWMSVMLQYQSLRSYPMYSEDEEQQQKQLNWQKEMRFQLMQKKRAIKREKRRLFKLKSSWSNKRISGAQPDTEGEESGGGRKRYRLNSEDLTDPANSQHYLGSSPDSCDSLNMAFEEYYDDDDDDDDLLDDELSDGSTSTLGSCSIEIQEMNPIHTISTEVSFMHHQMHPHVSENQYYQSAPSFLSPQHHPQHQHQHHQSYPPMPMQSVHPQTMYPYPSHPQHQQHHQSM